jgi:hypothetical protein
MDESAKSRELEQAWDRRLQELSAFKGATGHLNLAEPAAVPVSGTLLSWVKTQRTFQREGRLSPVRKTKLEALGFDWNPQDTVWSKWLQTYKDFIAQHERSDVAYIKQFDKELSIWVNHQKSALGQGRVPSHRVRELLAVGMTPAVRTERQKHSEADQARRHTVEELAAYVAKHGHAQMPSSRDSASLYMRVQKMRHIKDKRKNNWFVSELKRLGAFEQFPTLAWETAFLAWKAYAAETGDFACVQNPPRKVAAWAAAVRAELRTFVDDALLLPLSDRTIRANKSEAWHNVARARARLLAAGFVVEPGPLGERGLVLRKVAKVCGLAPSVFVPLRSLLRIVTNRAQSGMLGEAAAAELRAAGLAYNEKSKSWCQSTENRTQGPGVLRGEQTIIAPAPRTHAGVTRRSRARFRKEEAERKITRVPAFVDDASDWEEPSRLLVEVRRQFEFTDRPTTVDALLRRPSVQRVLSSDDEAENRVELEGALDELVKYGWIEFLPGPQMDSDMRKVRRAVYSE